MIPSAGGVPVREYGSSPRRRPRSVSTEIAGLPFAKEGTRIDLFVFSQSALSLDVSSWDVHAQRFFGARVLPDGVRGGGQVHVLVRTNRGPSGKRWVSVGPRTGEALALAEEAEARQGGGLGLLARRCPTVWTVAGEVDDDRVALLLAAILASVGLGPIVDPRRVEIFGVKTARAKLEAAPT